MRECATRAHTGLARLGSIMRILQPQRATAAGARGPMAKQLAYARQHVLPEKAAGCH